MTEADLPDPATSPIWDVFGRDDPHQMPSHFFMGAVEIDYESAVRADSARQEYATTPRFWYIDSRFRCEECRRLFVWSASEQRVWFEEYGFFVDAFPKHCPECRARRRNAVELRQEYDRLVAAARPRSAVDEKRRIVATSMSWRTSCTPCRSGCARRASSSRAS
jgi:hypothetical protein